MSDHLRNVIARNRAGTCTAIPSVCSAQPDVIRASLLLAADLDRSVVIEATSNQVNQDGGYTGMNPQDFVARVHEIADEANVDRARIIFGGDHLGPQAWRAQDSKSAMAKAHDMVRAYVDAGFRKIHLDCSEGCAGEASQLDDAITATRSAALAQTCVEAAGDPSELLFVVGTEVPPPGGARADETGDIAATTPQAATATLDAHAETFGDMTSLIGGLVVQPGVEFTPMGVHHLPLGRDPLLLQALENWPGVCLEAHSTDYQNANVFPRLASLGFAFQKVGPALTFAYRQALYALDQARGQMEGTPPHLQQTMEDVMLAAPAHWAKHYHGAEQDLYVQRHFGLADRIRYYWAHPAAQAAVQSLRRNVPTLPDPVLWQYFDQSVLDRADLLNGSQSQRLIEAQIQLALTPYYFQETS